MTSFPELRDEDFDQLDAMLREFQSRSGISLAVLIHRSGWLLRHAGALDGVEVQSIASLASNAYTAAESIIRDQMTDRSFSSVTMNGETFSGMVMPVDDHCLLLVIFKTTLSPGVVRSAALPVVLKLGEQVRQARARNPGVGFDFIEENKPTVSEVFRKAQDDAQGRPPPQ